MASRNMKTYDAMGKLPSNTLKRHPKMDLNKNDLLRLLSFLEGELQARDITIAALKAEKAKQLLYQAKYGRFGMGDPFHALQRDSDCQKDNSFDESAVKAMYDNQLIQLENLIATQRNAQQRMREQLVAVEKRYHKVCAELEEEKQKHAQDTAQGDDVTYMLEKDRERLKQELEFEKNQVKKLEKENKKLSTALEEERTMSAKHKQVALVLIKERKHYMEKLAVLQHHNTYLENALKEDKCKMKTMVEGLAQEGHKSLLMEAALEKQLSEFDTEREQLKGRLAREEARSAELAAQVEKLKMQLEMPGSQPVQGQSPGVTPPAKPAPAQGAKSFKDARVPVVHVRNSPDRDSPVVVSSVLRQPAADSISKHTTVDINNGPLVSNKVTERVAQHYVAQERPVPAQKPAVELNASRVNVIASSGTMFSSASGNTTVLTTPSGTRISLNVGTNVTPSSSRKPAPPSRGVPPPLPPNKPQVYIPSSGGPANITPRKDNMVRQTGGGGPSQPANLATDATGMHVPPAQQSAMQRLGITISKDKITIMNPHAPRDCSSPGQLILGRPGSRTQSNANVMQSSNSGDPASSGPQKPAQPNVTMVTKSSDASPSPEMPPSQNLDSFGREMEDLQKLLVSMATDIQNLSQDQLANDHMTSRYGPSENSTSSLDSQPSSSASSSVSSSLSSPSSSSSSLFSVSDASTSVLHKIVASGNVQAFEEYLSQNPQVDLTYTTKDGSTLLHTAAELGHEDLLDQLICKGCNISALNNDQATPLHLAASEGNLRCVTKLLDHGADLKAVDHTGWTPLHWAANHGHLDCCRYLLEQGARIDAMNKASWTPIHQAIHAGHADCLLLLLTYKCKPKPTTDLQTSGIDPMECLDDVISLVDKDGWTLAHLAASKESKDCLEVLANQCKLDLNRTDKWNRDVYQVASPQCKLFLQSFDSQTEKLCKVYINVPESRGNKIVDSEWHIGNMLVSADTGWAALEEELSAIFLNHLNEVEAGIRTRRSRQEQTASSPEGQLPFSLGLSLNSIKYYSIGVYHWSPGTLTERTPWELLGSMNTAVVAVQLFGMDDGCVDSLAYETLIPVAVLQNYLRLMDQYKNVIFYGPMSAGKTYMAQKLAQVILLKECHRGSSEVHTVQLAESFTSNDLVNLLISKDCLMESTMPVAASNKVTVILLDNLHKVSVSMLFKDIFSIMEKRGPNTTVRLQTVKGEVDYYMHPGCYILGTMDRTRSTGLELSIQQHFRWVQFRCDQEPMSCLLHRHLQRRLISSHGGQLPSSDDRVLKAVEWIVCVWQRLNEGINKLGLQDLYYGPIIFLTCPVQPNKPKAILRWLSLLWNHQLAPAVSEAVLKGAGGDSGLGGQQKVASTALYVLMQRAIVSGCPLSGQEKERYLSCFLGSNELDIKMRSDRKDSGSSLESPQAARKHVTDQIRHSPGPSVNQTNISTPFHRITRSPMTKAASLDSSLKAPDHLELPEQSAYHTSPDLSPNNKSQYGNTYFALAGFPVAKSAPRTTDTHPASSSPVSRGSRFGVPVIVTQPVSTAGSPSLRSSHVGNMMDSGEGSLMDKSRPVEVKRALSPQPVGTKAWSPGPDPRRALSPGPELLRGYQGKATESNSNSLHKSEAIHPSRHSHVVTSNKLLAPGFSQPGRFPSPVVVNPTKIPPFSNNKSPAFKS